MRDIHLLEAGAIGAALAAFVLTLCISEIVMRQRPQSRTMHAIELLAGIFTLATCALAGFLGTYHRPDDVPTWANLLLLVAATLLYAFDVIVFVLANNFAFTKRSN